MGCGCKEKKANELPKDGCGCGCGPSCSCKDCQEKWHGTKKTMGRFDEYPRPKAAMFDPRKIMQEWPEPSDDPLIPYVRANEQGLPYEMLNQYRGRPNTLHGWDAGSISLNGLTEGRLVKSSVANLLNLLAVEDLSMKELEADIVEYPDNFFHVPADGKLGQNVQYRKVKKAPIIETFFAFVPLIVKNGNLTNYEFFIRMGSPEARSYWDDDSDEIVVESAERKFVKAMSDYLSVYKTYDGIKKEGLRALQQDYPLYFAQGESADAKLFKVGDEGKAYSTKAEAYKNFANNLLSFIISNAMRKLSEASTSKGAKEDLKEMLKLVMQSCLDKSNLQDVADGLANAISERLQKDYEATEKISYYKYEIESLGPNSMLPIDSKLRSVFDKKRADLTVAISKFKDSLSTAFVSVITENNQNFSDVLKGLLDYDNIKQAQDRVKELENQSQQLQTTTQTQSSELQARLESQQTVISTQQQEIDRYKQEIARKEQEISEAKSQSEAHAMSETIKTESDTKNKTLVISAFALALATGAFFIYSHNKK